MKPTSVQTDTEIYYNYKQRTLLHVLATYCGHLKGGVNEHQLMLIEHQTAF
jgi:hypothetical protein